MSRETIRIDEYIVLVEEHFEDEQVSEGLTNYLGPHFCRSCHTLWHTREDIMVLMCREARQLSGLWILQVDREERIFNVPCRITS